MIDFLGWNSISFGPWGLCAFFARANPKGNGSWSVLLKETVLPEFVFYSRIFIRLLSSDLFGVLICKQINVYLCIFYWVFIPVVGNYV